MKKCALYILFVFLGVSVIDIAYRLICDYCYQHPRKESFIQTNYTFINCNTSYQFIILGASTARHSYVSQQIEDSLGVSCYNMGWDARSVLYQYLSLMKAIHNGGLEIAVLNLSISQLTDEWVKDRISELYPYYWYNDTIRNIVNEVKDSNMDILMISSLIQYNSKLDQMIRSEKNNKGYIPLSYTGNPTIVNAADTLNIIKPSFNKIAVKYLAEMVRECNKNKVRFIICLPPCLDSAEIEVQALCDLCDNVGAEMWNMIHTIQDPLLFNDGHHLNEKGAVEFTREFIGELRKHSIVN